MPYPNFHACRLKPPEQFSRLRQVVQGGVHMIIGRLKGSAKTVAQAIRYPKESWTVDKARASCSERGGTFEPASPEASAHLEQVPLLTTRLSEAEFQGLLAGNELEWTPERFIEAGLLDEDDGTVVTMADSEPLPTVDLKGVHIGDAGTYVSEQGQKITFTVEHLDEMVENHKRYGHLIKPYFKLMHLDEEEHKQVTAAPAIGWLENIYRVGNRLLADIRKVPKLVAELIDAGAYRRISPEIYIQWLDHNIGKPVRNVVRAAGLLGAKTPAIKTLADVKQLYKEEATPVVFASGQAWPETIVAETGTVLTFYEAEHQPLDTPDLRGGELDMKPEELQAILDKSLKGITERLDKLEKVQAKFTEPPEPDDTELRDTLGAKEGETTQDAAARVAKESATSSKALAKHEEEQEQSAVTQLIEHAVKEGRLLPAYEAATRKQYRAYCQEAAEADDSLVAFGEEGKEKRLTPLKALETYLTGLPKVLAFGEKGAKGDEQSTTEAQGLPPDAARYAESEGIAVAKESEDLNARIEERMAQARKANVPMTYEEAMDAELGTSRVILDDEAPAGQAI